MAFNNCKFVNIGVCVCAVKMWTVMLTINECSPIVEVAVVDSKEGNGLQKSWIICRFVHRAVRYWTQDLLAQHQASFVRHSLLHFLLSHMAVHHLHHLQDHRLHLLLLAQCFILNSRLGSSANPFLRLGSSANPFLHRPFPFLPDWLHGLSYHDFTLLNGWICLHGVLD